MPRHADSAGAHARPTRFRWCVAMLFFVIYTIISADRANLGLVLPFLRKEFPMSNTEAGALISLFLLAYGLVQLPAAWLISRFGVRTLFSLSIILTSLSTFFIGLSGSLFSLKLGRVALGIAEGPLPIGVTSTINHWFPSTEKGSASGIFQSSVKLGPVMTPILVAAIVGAWGWRAVFMLFAIPGVLLSLLWYGLVANRPSESAYVNQAECDLIAERNTGGGAPAPVQAMPWIDRLIRVRREPVLDSTRSVVTSWNIIGCALGFFFQYGISSVLLAWIPTYLLTVKQFSVQDMGLVAAGPWIGAIAGNIIGGVLSDRLFARRRKPGMLISAVSTAVMMYFLIHAPANPAACGLLLLLTGMSLSIGYSAYLAYPMSFVTKEKFPVASAVVNMGGLLGAAAAPWIVGMLLDGRGWNDVFAFLSGISCLTFLVVLTIAEPLNVQ
ncbi:MFS transporter [Janthinobacterium sp. Mn2066]|uniref:MFS transporter n=1 Tax=Janthinobacterium sp. Mn2066 TaxID=3395264 RepID=UPI003BD9ED70